MQYKMSLKQEIVLYAILVDLEQGSPLQELFASLEKDLLDAKVDLKLANETVKSDCYRNVLSVDYKRLSECL